MTCKCLKCMFPMNTWQCHVTYLTATAHCLAIRCPMAYNHSNLIESGPQVKSTTGCFKLLDILTFWFLTTTGCHSIFVCIYTLINYKLPWQSFLSLHSCSNNSDLKSRPFITAQAVKASLHTDVYNIVPDQLTLNAIFIVPSRWFASLT